VITKPPKRGGHSPRWAAEQEKIKKNYNNINNNNNNYTVSFATVAANANILLLDF
jgi:hypothetical protein